MFRKKAFLYHFVWLSWAVLHFLALPPFEMGHLAWVIFAPVLILLYTQGVSQMLYAFGYSLLFLLLSLFWLGGFWPPAFFLVPLIYACIYMVMFYFMAWMGKNYPGFRWIVVPIIWVGFEIFRSVGYHGFPWNLLGHTQWNFPVVVQSADIWGVYGVSFVVMLVNAVVAEWFLHAYSSRELLSFLWKKRVPALSMVGVIAFVFFYGVVQLHRFDQYIKTLPHEKLALIQPNIGSRDPWWENLYDFVGLMWRLNAEAALQQPDMIVWSETMIRHYIWHYLETQPSNTWFNKVNLRVLSWPDEMQTPMLITSPTAEGGRSFNSADLVDPDRPGYRPRNSKIHLAPFGEWLPVYDRIPFVRRIMEAEGAGTFHPSEETSLMRSRRGWFRVLICYEDVFGILARIFVKLGAQFFINTTNVGWAYQLGLNSAHWQHFAASLFTAVSVRRAIARATNTGVTGIIHMNGRWQGDIGDYATGWYVGKIEIAPVSLRSVYVRVGFLFPYVVFVLMVLVLGGGWWHARR